MASTPSIKEQARELIEQLPEDTSWEEILDKIRVRRAIERGLNDSAKGKTMPLNDVRGRFDLGPL